MYDRTKGFLTGANCPTQEELDTALGRPTALLEQLLKRKEIKWLIAQHRELQKRFEQVHEWLDESTTDDEFEAIVLLLEDITGDEWEVEERINSLERTDN